MPKQGKIYFSNEIHCSRCNKLLPEQPFVILVQLNGNVEELMYFAHESCEREARPSE